MVLEFLINLPVITNLKLQVAIKKNMQKIFSKNFSETEG